MKSKLIYITPRFPYPLITGDRIRCYNLLKQLSASFDITLVVLSGGSNDYTCLDPYVSEFVVLPKKKMARNLFDIALGLVKGWSIQECIFYRGDLRKLLVGRKFDVCLVHLLRSFANVGFIHADKFVMDMCDPVSLTYKQIVNQKFDFSFWYFVSFVEGYLTAHREKVSLNFFDRIFLHTKQDIEMASLDFPNVYVSTMGVGVEHIRPNFSNRDPYKIVFVGNLGYYPNYTGLEWFLQYVMPKLGPEWSVDVIGDGAHDLKKRFASTRVEFLGRVDDLSLCLGSAFVGIAPMPVASGIQNKVLEYIYSGLNVLATPSVSKGLLDEYSGSVISLEADADIWARALAELTYCVDDRVKFSEAVAKAHDWVAIADHVEGWINYE